MYIYIYIVLYSQNRKEKCKDTTAINSDGAV